jgi:hypothetical protein
MAHPIFLPVGLLLIASGIRLALVVRRPAWAKDPASRFTRWSAALGAVVAIAGGIAFSVEAFTGP